MQTKPLHLTLFYPGPDFHDLEPCVQFTPVSEATLARQAREQNRLTEIGRVELLVAYRVQDFRRKLSRALVVGFVAGALVTSLVVYAVG